MNGARIKYIIIVSVIAFVIWFIGEIILMTAFPESTMTAARVWAVAVFSAACAWSVSHFIREDKKREEEEENDNYKGVY